jgi:hypothetical protein
MIGVNDAGHIHRPTDTADVDDRQLVLRITQGHNLAGNP